MAFNQIVLDFKLMKPLVIIKAGSTFPTTKRQFGDFEDWVIDGCASTDPIFSVIDVIKSQELPEPEGISGAIITGSHSMVTDQASWMVKVEAWIPRVLKQNIPLMGICFGHQLLAQAMGGVVDYHDGGREIGTVPITLTQEGKQDLLTGTLPSVFVGHAAHAQTVKKLPPGAHLLAHNSFESHHAYRLGNNAWGVQFHPEFTAGIMNEYVIEQANSLVSEGYDIETLQSSICNTNNATGLLKGFVGFVKKNES
jgi:GMP synthase (glutamine-hydrolysing)